MLMRMLQDLPGAIGQPPQDDPFVNGRTYDVPDGLAETMRRNGWATDAQADPAPAPSYATKTTDE